METHARRQVAGLAALVAVVAGASWAFSPATVLGWLAGVTADPVRYGVVLLGVALVRPLLAWPTTLLAIAAGYGYGLPGIPVGLALITLTTLPAFLLARRADGGRVSAAGARFFAATGEFRGVMAARLAPAPSDAVSAAAGVAGVSTSAFVLGTALGELPWAVAGVLAGRSMQTLSTRGFAVGAPLVVGAAALAVLVLAGPAYRYLHGDGTWPPWEQRPQ